MLDTPLDCRELGIDLPILLAALFRGLPHPPGSEIRLDVAVHPIYGAAYVLGSWQAESGRVAVGGV